MSEETEFGEVQSEFGDVLKEKISKILLEVRGSIQIKDTKS